MNCVSNVAVITDDTSIEKIVSLVEPFSNKNLTKEGRHFCSRKDACEKMELYRNYLENTAFRNHLDDPEAFKMMCKEHHGYRNHLKNVLFAKTEQELLTEFPFALNKKGKVRMSDDGEEFLTFENPFGKWDTINLLPPVHLPMIKSGTCKTSTCIDNVDWKAAKDFVRLDMIIYENGDYDEGDSFDFNDHFHFSIAPKLMEQKAQKHITLIQFIEEEASKLLFD